VCCPFAIQIRRFGQSYGLFLTTQGPKSRSMESGEDFFVLGFKS